MSPGCRNAFISFLFLLLQLRSCSKWRHWTSCKSLHERQRETSICTRYRGSFPKMKVFKCAFGWRLWMGSILSFHLIASIAPIAPWIRIETQPTITCLLGGNAIVCCGSTSEGILKLKQHSESTSHFWLSGRIILPPGAWEPKIHIICHIDVLSGFHGQKWQPNKATGPHEFFHRRELLQYLDYQGYRCQGLSL